MPNRIPTREEIEALCADTSRMSDDDYDQADSGYLLRCEPVDFFRWLRTDLDAYNGMLSNEAIELLYKRILGVKT